MPLLSAKEVLNLKLRSVPAPKLRSLASELELDDSGSMTEIITRILKKRINGELIDRFIKKAYAEKIQKRQALISSKDLKRELTKVKTFSWGVVQGQLDRKIQTEYVRRVVRYDDLIESIAAKLYDDVKNYVICTWYNHWTTVLVEEQISTHKRVIPTIKNIKGIDIFFAGQPFDLKVTYLPHNYDHEEAIRNPSALAIWMYENQGAQRFGTDNRLFVILLDKDNPERSWELKRDFNLISKKINNFFDTETVSKNDEVVFAFGKKTYTTVTKILLVTK